MHVIAHAFGARYDLPIPLLLFVLGGGVVVALSFVLLRRAGTVHEEGTEPTAPTVVERTPVRRPHPVAGAASVVGLFSAVDGFRW